MKAPYDAWLELLNSVSCLLGHLLQQLRLGASECPFRGVGVVLCESFGVFGT